MLNAIDRICMCIMSVGSFITIIIKALENEVVIFENLLSIVTGICRAGLFDIIDTSIDKNHSRCPHSLCYSFEV